MMKSRLPVCLILCLCCGVPTWALFGQDLEGYLHKIENCPGMDFELEYANPYVTRKNKDDYAFGCDIMVKHDIPAPIQIQYRVQKCKDKDKPDSCEHALTGGNNDDYCPQLNSSYIANVLRHAKMEPVCPLKVGTYKLIDFPFTMDEAFKMSMSTMGTFFKLWFEATANDKKLLCLYCEMGLRPKTNKRRFSIN